MDSKQNPRLARVVKIPQNVFEEEDLILKIRNLNTHIVCALCAGYFIDATTISECSHTFCKSCIVKHLQTKKSCPECSQKIHETQPLLNLRSDRVMQDVVYKLVPHLFQNEQQREAEFYRTRGLDFSLSGSHLLNIGTPLKYTQQKILREVLDHDIPDVDVKKIPNLHRAHNYEFDEKVCICLELGHSNLYHHCEDGTVQLQELKFMPLAKKYVRCATRATIWHFHQLLLNQLHPNEYKTQYQLKLTCCGHDLHNTSTIKQVVLLHWYADNSFDTGAPPVVIYDFIRKIDYIEN